MKRPTTRVRNWKERTDTTGLRTGVSLHSHTNYSKETLDFIPYYASRIPIVSRLVRAEIADYERRTGWKTDFSQAYWTPPVSASMVLDAERTQIQCELGLEAIVSITDHDTIEAGLELHPQHGAAAPISVEWTVPLAGSHVHLGVHHLPATEAVRLMTAFRAFTADARAAVLSELLVRVHECSETLVVLNHPLWDHRRVGAALHLASIEHFLGQHRRYIHAIEINGLRSWQENQAALALANRWGLPAVSGGDRHALRPNTVVNVTTAQTWAEFVGEVRVDHHSEIWLLPGYWEPVDLRTLEGTAEVLRRYRTYPYGQRRFLDRVYIDIEGFGFHPLTFYWDGIPWWLRPVLAVVRALGGRRLRPLMRWALSSPTTHSPDAALQVPFADAADPSVVRLKQQQEVV